MALTATYTINVMHINYDKISKMLRLKESHTDIEIQSADAPKAQLNNYYSFTRK